MSRRAKRVPFRPLLATAVLALSGCASGGGRQASLGAPRPAPAAPEAAASARELATEHFYRGKAFALAGEADCAASEFREALETFRLGERPENPEDEEFAGQLWESIRLYDAMLARNGESGERPPAEDTRDSLVAAAPASSPQEVEKAGREVAGARRQNTFDIPMVVNEAVLKAVAYYQFRTPRAFAGALKRSGRYLDLMRRTLSEQGLPQDLVYVAMVESAFRHQAHSRKAAHGFWQFVRGTARRYGLKRTSSLDERSDPIKSTQAAARYFRDLYEMFGDWYLAMAAYDAGEGKILRILQRIGTRDYWDVRTWPTLHRETRDYVPFVLAAALIAKDPARYGFDVVPDPPLTWETIRVPHPVDLARVARVLGTPLEALRLLNSELKTRFTPHGVGAYELRVPPGTAPLLTARLGSLPAAPDVAERRIVVRRGESLAHVARRAGVTVAELRDWNDLPGNVKLRKGTVLTVPTRTGGGGDLSAAREAASVAPPRTGGEIRALPTSAAAVKTPSDVGALVSPTPAATLASADLPSRVEIPREGFVEDPSPAPAGATTAGGGTVRYTVRRGDTLYRIATRFHVPVGVIQRRNGIDDPESLRAGQHLKIPLPPGR